MRGMRSLGDDDEAGSGELFDDGRIGCREKFHCNRARSFAQYQDSLVPATVLLKLEQMEPLADWFADRLADLVRKNGKALEADVVVPVPLPISWEVSRCLSGRGRFLSKSLPDVALQAAWQVVLTAIRPG